jgi:hypothetical protein
MKITEVQHPSDAQIAESVKQGLITEAVGKIIQAQGNKAQWTKPMTLEEFNAYEAQILAEAGVK